MPVGRMGPRCACGGPAGENGQCRRCEFGGVRPPEPEPVIAADDPRFEVELRAWLETA
jgi:hypothetical protein